MRSSTSFPQFPFSNPTSYRSSGTYSSLLGRVHTHRLGSLCELIPAPWLLIRSVVCVPGFCRRHANVNVGDPSNFETLADKNTLIFENTALTLIFSSGEETQLLNIEFGYILMLTHMDVIWSSLTHISYSIPINFSWKYKNINCTLEFQKVGKSETLICHFLPQHILSKWKQKYLPLSQVFQCKLLKPLNHLWSLY